MGSGLVDHDPVVALNEGNDINRATKMIPTDRRPLIWKPLLTFGVPALMQRSSTLACRRTRVATAAFLALCIPPLGEDEDYAHAVDDSRWELFLLNLRAPCFQPLGGNYTRAVGVYAKR